MKTLAVTIGNNQPAVKDFSLVDRWINFAQVKPTTEKAYRKGIKNFVGYLRKVGINSPADVTRQNCVDYRNNLETAYKSASTRNLYITSVKLFFAFLHVEGFISNNPALHLKGFKISSNHKRDAVTIQDNKKILSNFDTSTLKGKRDYALYTLLAVTGLRTVEASRALVGDLREEINGEIFLYIQGKGRDDKGDKVHIPAAVLNILQNYLNARGNVSKSDPLFASLSHRNFGKAISTCTISTIIKNIFRSSGINADNLRVLSAHSLRHGAATTALMNGASLREVQNFLRHTSINVTTRYLHDIDRLNNPSESLVASAFGLV